MKNDGITEDSLEHQSKLVRSCLGLSTILRVCLQPLDDGKRVEVLRRLREGKLPETAFSLFPYAKNCMASAYLKVLHDGFQSMTRDELGKQFIAEVIEAQEKEESLILRVKDEGP